MLKNAARLIVLVVIGFCVLSRSADKDEPQKKQTTYFGSSGGNVRDSTSEKCCSGTLGALVTDGNKAFILSNNHVLGLLGAATPGDPISQPGLIDNNCSPPRTVAKFTAAPPLSSNVDAAIAEIIDSQMDANGTILGIGQISSNTVAASVGLKVTKSGRTTGVTLGSIQSYPTNLKVDYSGGCKGGGPAAVSFTNLIVIEGKSGAFSAGGDSGSLIITEASHSPVGLLFAGNSTLTLANPIDLVLEKLSSIHGRTLSFPSRQLMSVLAETAVLPQVNAQAVSKMNQLSGSVMSNPAVLGVGVARMETGSNPELIIYVERGQASSAVSHAGVTFTAEGEAQYQGVSTRIVETEPFRAYNWNQQAAGKRRLPDIQCISSKLVNRSD